MTHSRTTPFAAALPAEHALEGPHAPSVRRPGLPHVAAQDAEEAVAPHGVGEAERVASGGARRGAKQRLPFPPERRHGAARVDEVRDVVEVEGEVEAGSPERRERETFVDGTAEGADAVADRVLGLARLETGSFDAAVVRAREAKAVRLRGAAERIAGADAAGAGAPSAEGAFSLADVPECAKEDAARAEQIHGMCEPAFTENEAAEDAELAGDPVVVRHGRPIIRVVPAARNDTR